VRERVRDAGHPLELPARHVRYVQVVEVVPLDPRVVEAGLARLREQLADPGVALPELGHRRADDRYAFHTRTLAGEEFIGW